MKPLLATAIFMLAPGLALAQLTPQDIIDHWQRSYAAMGNSLTTGPAVEEGTITRYPDVTIERNMGSTQNRLVLDYVEITPLDDGTLEIRFSPRAEGFARVENRGETLQANISYDLSALTIRAEGSPEDISYRASAPIITAYETVSGAGPDATISVIMEALQGELQSQERGLAQQWQLRIGNIEMQATFSAQGRGVSFVDYQAANLALALDMRLPEGPEGVGPVAPLSVLPEDGVIGMTLTTGPATTRLRQKSGNDGSSSFTFTQEGGEFTAAYAENVISFGVTATGGGASLANSPTRPVDFSASFASAHLGATYPLQPTQGPAPFALTLALEGLTMDDPFWQRIDPEATLSHAPASFRLGLNGEMRLLVSPMDQTALAALRRPPFEFSRISLTDLVLELEGMRLSGEGDIRLDNSRNDPETGRPEATGTLDFTVTGALALLDKLSRLGLGDPMFFIGAKGMLGMFATPNAAPDSFSTRIELLEGGHISVNGQQVK